MAHRLRGALSPYLRQHQDNPVDWWQWGDEAFAEARQRDVPVLLSVGYAACHWCHVMAHESFEDEATAGLMNARFVSIKVDREERPDIDAVYMAATQALTGRGGWPMTVFLDHDARPFYAGTYFPPRPHPGMPSFTDVLTSLDEAWRMDRERVLRAATYVESSLAEAPRAESSPVAPGRVASDVVSIRHLLMAVDRLAGEFDPVHGGFGGAPKFPPSPVLEFLLRAHALTLRPGGRALGMAMETLEAMARGGMFDQLTGGFARYSVDAQWVVPHFEKMLSDNAQLLRVYVHAWRLTRDPVVRRVATQTAEFLLAELATVEGGFASSLDADSAQDIDSTKGTDSAAHMDGTDAADSADHAASASAAGGPAQEGAFYVWTRQQLAEVLGPEDGAWVADLTSVTAAGTFEHDTSVLQMRHDPDDPPRWVACRAALAAARSRRPRPARDDKVVASWNGLAVAALAEAGALLDRPDWIRAARRCADLLVGLHWSSERSELRRVSLGGVVGEARGVLSDYADLAEGMLMLYQVTGVERWFDVGRDLVEVILERFPDGRGGFFDTDSDAPRLVRRPQDPGDGVAASGWTSAAQVLLTLGALTGEDRYRAAAEGALAALLPLGRANPRFLGWGWAAICAMLAGPLQVAVVLPDGGPEGGRGPDVGKLPQHDGPPKAIFLDALHLTALTATSPGLVVAVAREARSRIPLLLDRPAIEGRPTAYLCRGFVCDLPITDPEALQRALER